jgi:hypothetical protein
MSPLFRNFRPFVHKLMSLFDRLLCLLAPLFQNLFPLLSAASFFSLYHFVSSNHTITVFSLTEQLKDAFLYVQISCRNSCSWVGRIRLPRDQSPIWSVCS